MHGQAVVFCQSQGLRQLTTTKLNTTSASALQFTIGSGSCRWGKNDPRISLYFSRSLFMDDVQSWTKVESIRLSRRGTVHIVPLPQEARAFGVTLRWQQDFVRLRDGIVLANKEENGYQGCWALDNVLVVNGARRPAFLQDDMDPMNTDNWLFFPGAVIKVCCPSFLLYLCFP
uniref:Reelin n=1 Tax=Eptatretus burgeri TaxID=7764 RepID=A0A8C4R0D7_EPTBU